MLYLVAGMNRSGSTWLYNVVRLLLARSGAPDLAAGWVEDREKLLKHRTAVVKVHIFDPSLLIEPYMVLTSHRDLRDVAASLARKFKLPASVEMTRYVFNQYRRWAELARFDMCYEAMIADAPAMVGQVAAALGVEVDATAQAEVAAEVDAAKRSIRADTRGFDPQTLLHTGHITDGRPGSWREDLSPERADEIVKGFRSWMELQGYLSDP